MTSATERTDDDVIVITDAHVVGSSRTDADETSDSGDREVSDDSALHADDRALHADDSALHADDSDLNTDDEQLDDDDLDDDELAAGGERGDHLTTSADATGDDGVPSGSSAFAMPGADSSADSSADSTASAGSGPFAMASTEPDDSLAEPDDSHAAPLAAADASSADAAPVDVSSADATPADAAPVDASPAHASPVAASSAHQPDNSNWPEIQSMFVDDPRSAVERAAEVAGAALAGLVAAAKDREQSLRSDWAADGTGTEELRTSLQHYRELATRLTGLSQEL